MIEEQLGNYGVLGVWTMTLLWDRYKTQREMRGVIVANTKVLNIINERFNKKKW